MDEWLKRREEWLEQHDFAFYAIMLVLFIATLMLGWALLSKHMPAALA